MNRCFRAVVVAPLTTSIRPYPSRVKVRSAGMVGQIVIDQLRTVDKARLAVRLDVLNTDEAALLLDVLKGSPASACENDLGITASRPTQYCSAASFETP